MKPAPDREMSLERSKGGSVTGQQRWACQTVMGTLGVSSRGRIGEKFPPPYYKIFPPRILKFFLCSLKFTIHRPSLIVTKHVLHH